MRLKTCEQNIVFVTTLCASVLAAGDEAAAKATIAVDEDTWLSVGLLMQPQVRFTREERDGETRGWLFDPLVRRTRVMVYGQLSEWVNFFMETDTPNFGYQQDYEKSRTYVQDAYVELNFGEAFQLDVGLILPPFSHHGMQGATTLLGLDYHVDLVKPPTDAHTVWRDVGFMMRGLLFGKSLAYRVAITNGVQRKPDPEFPSATDPTATMRNPLNKDDVPRVTARLCYNLFEAEGGAGAGGMFLDGLYLREDGGQLVSHKRVVSFGVSASAQPEVAYGADQRPKDYRAFAADVFVDLPISDGTQSLNGQVNFFLYRHGAKKSSDRGMGMFGELGYRIGRMQPVLGVDWFDVDSKQMPGDLMQILFGFNYWIHGHNASVKAQFGARRVDVDGDAETKEEFEPSGTIQTQILF